MDDSLFEDKPFEAPELDDSLFEDKPFEAAPVQAQEASPFTPEQLAGLKEAKSDPVVSGAIGAAVGAGTGKAINALGEGSAKLLNKAVEKVGSLSPEQMSHISGNADAYRTAPDLSSTLNQYRDLAEKTRQKGFSAKGDALKALEGAEDIPVQEYFKALSETAKSPKYSSEIAPNVQQTIQEERMSQVRPALDQKSANAAALEQKLAQVKGGQFEDIYSPRIEELEQNLANPKPEVPFEARQEERVVKQDRKLQRLDEKIKKTETKLAQSPEAKRLQESLQSVKERKEDFLLGKGAQEKRIDIVKENKDLTKLEQMQKELEELKATKASEQAKFQAKQSEQTAKIEANKAKVEADIANKAGSAKAKADSDFSKKVLRTPEEIRNVDPEFFNQRTFDADFAKSLDRAVDKGRNVEKLSPTRIAEGILPSLRDNANFSMTGASSVDKFNTDISEGVRDYLGQKFPEYDKNMKASSDAIGAEEKFKKLGIAIDKDTGTVSLPEGQRAKIAGILSSDADKFIDEKALLQSLADDLSKQGILPTNDPQAFLDTMKNSALKDSVKNTQQLRLSGYDLVNTAKSPTGAAKPLFDSYGTKIQEAVALGKAEGGLLNTLGKAGKSVAGALPGILGVGGAILGATSAAQAGELSPEEATVAGAVDAINPLPLDAVQGAVQGKKAYNDSMNEQKMTEEYFNGGETSQSQALGQGAIGAAKGLVQPVVDLAETANQAGVQASTDARSRMEQRFNASSSASGKYTTPSQPVKSDKPKQNDFLDFVEKNPESLVQLADQLSSTQAGQSYAGPLQKAAEADERTRTAILFGLYQQPAFRSLIGGESTMISKNIPGVKKAQE